jgi:hypothetical protein
MGWNQLLKTPPLISDCPSESNIVHIVISNNLGRCCAMLYMPIITTLLYSIETMRNICHLHWLDCKVVTINIFFYITIVEFLYFDLFLVHYHRLLHYKDYSSFVAPWTWRSSPEKKSWLVIYVPLTTWRACSDIQLLQ